MLTKEVRERAREARAKGKGDSEAPSNGGKEEWVRGLLSLSFSRYTELGRHHKEHKLDLLP